MALYLLASIVAGLAGRAPLNWFLGWALPSLVVSAVLGVFGHPLPAWSLALLASVIPAWFATYNRLVKTEPPPQVATG